MRKREREIRRMLEAEEYENRAKQPDFLNSTDDIHDNKTVRDKLKRERTKKEFKNVDYSKKENEIYIETPLPFSLASDLIPIKKIINGVIYTEDGRYLKMLEVFPINFLLKSREEQDNIIYNFEKYLRIIPARVHIKSFANRSDITDVVNAIDNNISKERNKNCIAMQEDYKKLVKEIGTEAITRRFFIIFEYEKKPNRKETEREITDSLNTICSNAQAYLKNCGNRSVFPMGNDATNDTAKMLFDILNRSNATEEEYIDHMNDIYLYYQSNYGEKSLEIIPTKEYVSPTNVIFGKDYTQINDLYYSFLPLTGNGFPAINFDGWLSLIVNAGDGIDMDLYIQKEDKSKKLEEICRRIRLNKSRIQDIGTSNTEYDEIENEFSSGMYLKSKMRDGSEEFWYIAIMVTICSPSIEGLVRKKEAIIDYLKTHEIHVFECEYLQKEAFTSYLPLCKMEDILHYRAKRNTLTSGLATCYPFTSFEICDPKGILLGTNEMNNSLVILDPFNTRMLKNANMTIMGVAGAGKTYLLQLLAMRYRRNDIQTFIIAPDKGHEFKRGCDAIGGEFITIAPSSPQCINVMEIRKKDISAKKALGMMTEQSELAEKIQMLHVFFSLLIPDITAEEDQFLDDAIIATYEKFGITDDNASLLKNDGSGDYKEMPILGDLYEELLKNEASKRIANIINRLVNGSAKSFNKQTNVDLDNKYIVLDVSRLNGSPLLTIAMFLAIDTVYSKSKENITTKKAIIIDEVGEVIGSSSNKKAASHVSEIFRIIRGYGGGAICATQNLSDFFSLEDGKYGKVILNNSNTKIILKLENKEGKAVKDLLELSENEYQKIINFERGHALLSENGNNIPIQIKASKVENDLITTDRGENELLMHLSED